MKQCFKCKAVLSIDEFYAHPQMGDGHLGKCKRCTRADNRENRAKKHERYAAYEQERNRQSERKEKKLEYQRRRRERSPHKDAARDAVGRAIRNGSLNREPCSFCGNPKSQAHHHDYSKPLDVTWVCFKCHRIAFHGQIVSEIGESYAVQS